jgi:hypothetical protein
MISINFVNESNVNISSKHDDKDLAISFILSYNALLCVEETCYLIDLGVHVIDIH